jgi:hypothetical protein
VTIRWGIIGCGNVRDARSGPGVQKALGSELAMVMRRDAAGGADYAGREDDYWTRPQTWPGRPRG